MVDYEQEDYDDFKRNLTDEHAMQLLERISSSYLPDYNYTGKKDDFDYYCLHQAIYRAMAALEERSDGK